MPIRFPSLFFCVDVKHAHDLATVMRSHGVRVYPVSGKTPDSEEQRFYRLFAAGEIDGLASCGVLTEGFDAPCAMGAFLARPTKSGLLYRQVVGRVLRPFPAPQGDRHYQQDCLDVMLAEARDGIQLQLAVLPTGCGKTFLSAQVPERVIRPWKGRRMRRMLFLVHRDNLVQQAAATFRDLCGGYTVGVEAGGGRYAGDADIVVASVQSLGSTKVDQADGVATFDYGPRLRSLRPEQFDVVIVDESHHAAKGGSYHNVLRYMNLLKGEDGIRSDCLLLCITATPNRSDNLGMEVICDKIVYEYPLVQAVKDGYLAPIRAVRVETEVDISKVSTNRGDFSTAELEATVNTPERNELIAQEYLKIREQVGADMSNVGPWSKPYAMVVDFVDIAGRHSLITAPTLFGLRAEFDGQGKDIIEQSEEVQAIQEEHPGLDLQEASSMEDVRRRLESVRTTLSKLDLLRPPESPSEVRKFSKFTWLKEGEGRYHLGLLEGGMLSCREDGLGSVEVFRHRNGVRTKLHHARDLKAALEFADKQVPDTDRKVLAADAAWRKNPPTEKQIGKLWMLNRKLKAEFKSKDSLYQFALQQHHSGNLNFSCGGVSNQIDQLSSARR